MTNNNFFMEIQGATYVIREPGFKTEEIIDRAVEEQNNKIASDLGINSECVYFDRESGVKISRYIDRAQTFTSLNPASTQATHSAAALLNRLHTSPTPFSNHFCWETELSKYESIVHAMNCSLFSDYEQCRQQLTAFVRRHVHALSCAPCHNDTVPENFLMSRKNNASYLIDWEYSGLNDPAWDVAMYIAESCLPQPAIVKFLSYYYGFYPVSHGELMKLKCFVMAQDLLWSVWAMIRYYSGEDFLDYLYNRYNRFRRNLSSLLQGNTVSLAEMVRM